jgi:hypothetical protein
VLTAMLVASFVGCGPQPAAIRFDGDPVVTVATLDPVPLKKAEVLDKNGKAITPAPEITWTVTPGTVAMIEGGKTLRPLTSGEATVMATIGKVHGQYAFIVSVPDRLRIRGYLAGTPIVPGTTMTLTADALTGEKLVPNQIITWKSSNDTVATVLGGRVTAISPGTATITAMLGKLQDNVDLLVSGTVPVQKMVEVTRSMRPITPHQGVDKNAQKNGNGGKKKGSGGSKKK